jgi:hypothetical protein
MLKFEKRVKFIYFHVSCTHAIKEATSPEKNLSQELAIPSDGSRSDGQGAMRFDSGTAAQVPVPGPELGISDGRTQMDIGHPNQFENNQTIKKLFQQSALPRPRRRPSWLPCAAAPSTAVPFMHTQARRATTAGLVSQSQSSPELVRLSPSPRPHHTGRVAQQLRPQGSQRFALWVRLDMNRAAISNSSTTVLPVCPCTHLELNRSPAALTWLAGPRLRPGRSRAPPPPAVPFSFRRACARKGSSSCARFVLSPSIP